MGDRTWARVEFPESQLELFKKHFPYIEDEDFTVDRGVMDAIMQEINYGGTDLFKKIAEEGGVFVGNHGSGGDYGEMSFTSNGTDYEDVVSLEDEPMVPVGDDDVVGPRALKHVRRYHRTLAGAEAVLSWIRSREQQLTRRRRLTDGLEGIHMLKIASWIPVLDNEGNPLTTLASETDAREVFSVQNIVFKRVQAAENVSVGYDMARFVPVMNMETGDINVIPKEQEVTICSKVTLSDEVLDGG
jgi:hypothetical protein